MNTEQAKALLQRYRMGLCSPQETAAIEAWYQSMADSGNADWSPGEKETFEKNLRQNVMTALHREETPVITLPGQKRLSYWKRAVVAASILMVIAAGGYFLLTNKPATPVTKTEMAQPPVKNDVMPGIRKAVLILADGSRLVLDSTEAGTLATEKNVTVVKTEDGQIAYRTEKTEQTEIAYNYNTITVPRGADIVRLTLADNSKVWLDAGSSIVYPVVFTGSERKVEITGQAYFEIAKNPAMPFIVKKRNGDAEVRVLGTHFNINAYDDEAAMKITLLEGAVKVTNTKSNRVLAPGQQLQINPAGEMVLVTNADTEGVMAWKNGYFRLTSSDLPSILRQVQRWYDVELQEGEKLNSGSITGTIPRNTSLLNVLKVLTETSGIRFRLDGKRVIIE